MSYRFDIPAGIPESDRQLLLKARSQRWEDIDPEAAQTEAAKNKLYDIMESEYHYAEAREDW